MTPFTRPLKNSPPLISMLTPSREDVDVGHARHPLPVHSARRQAGGLCPTYLGYPQGMSRQRNLCVLYPLCLLERTGIREEPS